MIVNTPPTVGQVHLRCANTKHHMDRILWRNDSNGNQVTDQEYTGHQLVSHETKVKTQNYHHAKHCTHVTLQGEKYYEIKIKKHKETFKKSSVSNS